VASPRKRLYRRSMRGELAIHAASGCRPAASSDAQDLHVGNRLEAARATARAWRWEKSTSPRDTRTSRNLRVRSASPWSSARLSSGAPLRRPQPPPRAVPAVDRAAIERRAAAPGPGTWCTTPGHRWCVSSPSGSSSSPGAPALGRARHDLHADGQSGSSRSRARGSRAWRPWEAELGSP